MAYKIMDLLCEPELYQKTIAKLHEKNAQKSQLFTLKQDAISFYNFSFDRRKLSKLLARAIKKQKYHFSPSHEHTIKSKNKKREVQQFCITDLIVADALYDALVSYLDKFVSPYLYSYIKGRSILQPARRFANYVKQNKYKKEFYVLHTDIFDYFNQVPVHNNSVLWKILNEFLQSIDSEHAIPDYLLYLLKTGTRPTIISPHKLCYEKIVGLPTGLSFAALMSNLYLREFDELLGGIEGGFYARYCDDIIFVHSDLAMFRRIDQQITEILTKLKLKQNLKKQEYVYLTKAGCPCKHDTSFLHSSKIDFLGLSINTSGVVSIQNKIVKSLLKEIKQIIVSAAALCGDQGMEQQGYYICNMLNDVLYSDSAKTLPRIRLLLLWVDDREQLQRLDRQIALFIAETITKIKGVRAFRHISYRHMRQVWNLPSLCNIKNSLGKHTSE